MATIHSFLVAVFAGALLAGGAHAQHDLGPSSHPRPHATPVAPGSPLPYAGVVRGVNLQTGEVTLRHGPIVDLGMPAMTMSYLVADESQLKALRPGDHVKFAGEHVHGAFVVTGIAKVPPGGK